jgi:hypothetical protein
MLLPTNKLVGIMVLATAGASAALLARRHATAGEIPRKMGLRASVFYFLGFWVGICFYLWSFTFEGSAVHWRLLGIGIASAFTGRAIADLLSKKTSLSTKRDMHK